MSQSCITMAVQRAGESLLSLAKASMVYNYEMKETKRCDFTWWANEFEKLPAYPLLGKTFTLDPINKRRLANMGEEDQFYIKDHHEPIVTREVWEAAQRIREKRK